VSKGIDRHNGDQRPVVGRETLSNDIRGGALLDVAHGVDRPAFERDITSAASAASASWEGWGTALKPAWEPIVMARKPLSGTVAANVLEHGTGALNVGGCRVEHASDADLSLSLSKNPGRDDLVTSGVFGADRPQQSVNRDGRWPANVIHDGSAEVLAAFPDSLGGPGGGQSGKDSPGARGVYEGGYSTGGTGTRADRATHNTGSAARFFYTAKADADDRLGSKHPTVKPLDLMQYLVRLVTPPGGLVLDPFAGTGTTGEAAFREGMRAVLIEREPEYQADIARRMELAENPTKRAAVAKSKNNLQGAEGTPLFGDEAA
jgi:site-specific DNA-methyltransferase (adenine-specific)